MDDVELSRLTIGALLDHQAEQFGDREFVAYPDRDVRLTYRQFRDRVDLVGRGLMALGVRKGEHVAVWAPNIPEWLLLQYATAKIGAILVPVDTACRADELEVILRSSESTTLLLATGAAEVDYLAELHSVLPDVDDSPVGHGRFEKLPRLQRLFSIGRTRFAGMLRFDDLFDLAAQTHVDDYRRRSEAHSSFEVINLRYARAADGSFKGVMLAHRNVLLNALHATDRMRLTENDRVCAAIPLFHGLGATIASVGTLLRGARLIPVEKISPSAVLEAITNERCTAVCGMPQMFSTLLEHPERASFDLASVRTGIVGGSPVGSALMRDILETLGVEEMTSAYGAAEVCAVITQTSPDDPLEKRLGSAGRVLAGMQVKIVDPKTGEAVPPRVEGELCCRGHSVMKGYFKDPEATAAAIDPDGWFHTRDLAVADHEGYVNILSWPRDATSKDRAAAPHEIGRQA
jgi:fatty-acyl-CoA synthase